MTNTLKFPNGDFTHTELAQANGKTNQQVWVAYQQAIKNGLIVFVGTRSSGKGKPSKLWRVANGQPVPVVAVIVPPVVVPPPVVVKPENVITITEPDVVISVPPPEPVIESLVEIKPVTPPPVPVVEPVAEIVEVITVVPVVNITSKDVTELEQVCPICKHKLLSIDTATGVRVWCPQPIEVCFVTENPFGHGRNAKDAYEILCEKFRHISHAKA